MRKQWNEAAAKLSAVMPNSKADNQEPEETPVTVTLTYTQMTMVEWALYDLKTQAADRITFLSNKENRDTRDIELINVYQNRIRRLKHVIAVIGAALTNAEATGG